MNKQVKISRSVHVKCKSPLLPHELETPLPSSSHFAIRIEMALPSTVIASSKPTLLSIVCVHWNWLEITEWTANVMEQRCKSLMVGLAAIDPLRLTEWALKNGELRPLGASHLMG